jgi:hypothetical protein
MYKYYVWLEVHRRLLKCTNIMFDLRYTGVYGNVKILCLAWGIEVVTEMYKYYVWLEVHRRLLKCTNIMFDLRYTGGYWNV